MDLAHLPSVRRFLPRSFGAIASVAPAPTGVAKLEESDLAAINAWLCETRVRTGLIVATAMPLIGWFGGVVLPWLQVTTVCLVTAAANPLYHRALREGVALARLVYVQLIVDT